ncbi:MAG: hypothetical protein LBG99_07290 [Propionibacteriaceae bacterium]|jgi:hypothetical protein|nr:hypothetical protein [Propionibacteriaceae bacterium]
MLPIIAGVVFFIMGIIMLATPQTATKKELRGSPEAVKKTRNIGIFVTIFGVIMVIVGLI